MKTTPCTLVIFGASGDLTKRLLIPALLRLQGAGFLHPDFRVLGLGRTPHTDESFKLHLKNTLLNTHYLQGDSTDPHFYPLLAEKLKNTQNIIFYMATLPEHFLPITQFLFQRGLLDETAGFRRVVYEKPFGVDYASAKHLNESILKCLKEEQIYRIDHYLGKETVQNILAFRFANGIFEPLWNHHYIDHVQITVAESLGIENRGAYYDQTGALKDMVPNHLFQLLTLIAMEPPSSFDAEKVRNEKTKVLESIKPFTQRDVWEQCVRGQYEGYCGEAGTACDSLTETYFAMRLYIDNWRWAGVPFYMRTGKKLEKRLSEIAIFFKKAPSQMFQAHQTGELSSNTLIMQLQPNESISLRFGAKTPGPGIHIQDVNMQFRYEDYFLGVGNGYEGLLYDCMMGDATQFQRADMLLSAWRVVEPILQVFKQEPAAHFPNYKPGSKGPREAHELIKKDGRGWLAQA